MKNTPTDRKLPRLGCARLLIGLIGGLALLIGGVILMARQPNNPAACLRFQDGFLNTVMIDLHSGTELGRPPATLSPMKSAKWDTNRDVAKLSPDGRYVVYADYSGFVDYGQSAKLPLYLRSARLTSYQFGKSLGIHTDYGNNIYKSYQWSPDSRWIAYYENAGSGSITVGLVSIQGKPNITYKLNSTGSISYYHWSADNQYLALITLDPDAVNHHLYVWSIPTLKLSAARTFKGVASMNGSITEFSIAQWSPKGHRLAYLTKNDLTNGVVLMSMDRANITDNLLNTNFSILSGIPIMSWSPDGVHLAIIAVGKDGSGYHLDLVSEDNSSAPITISDTIVPFNCSSDLYFPTVTWTADSQSLVYMSNSLVFPAKKCQPTGDFFAYRLITKTTDLLARQVYINFQPTANSEYAYISWFERDHAYTGVIHNSDGKILDAHPRIDGPGKSGEPERLINWVVKDKWLLLDDWCLVDNLHNYWLLNVTTGERHPIDASGETSPDQTRMVRVTLAIRGTDNHLDKLMIENLDGTGSQAIPLVPDVLEPNSQNVI